MSPSVFKIPIEQSRNGTQEIFPLNPAMFIVPTGGPDKSKAFASLSVMSNTCEPVSKKASEVATFRVIGLA
uniref:MSP domain-containing protein n=1 Tax=Heterorhabditis bacteriophora TaxID=37862 RepID=A0A1I7X1S0_HETBA